MGGHKLITGLFRACVYRRLMIVGGLAIALCVLCAPESHADSTRNPGAHIPAGPSGVDRPGDLPSEPPQPCDLRAKLPGNPTIADAPGIADETGTGSIPVSDSSASETIASIADLPPTPENLDYDGDGVPDSEDLCPDTPGGLAVDKTGCLVMTQLRRRLILHVSYVPGTTAPDRLSLRILDDLATRLKRAPSLRVLVEGFTDNIGNEQANLRVSQKRAGRIKRHLVKRGIAPGRIDAVGRGESRFIATNDTAAGRQKNRRIEITCHRD